MSVALCDSSGRIVWGSNPDYQAGVYAWEYASVKDREACKNAVSRALVLRDTQRLDATSHIGEHFHVWMWPLESLELALCILALQVPNELTKLTEREKQSLQLLAQGLSTREIAKSMDVSVSTVHTHFLRARKKLKLRSVEALIGFSARYCYPPTVPLKDGGKKKSNGAA